MSQELYRKLIDEICAKANIPDPESMYGVADLQVKGVQFSMFHYGELQPDYAVSYCDFGPLPTEGRDAVLLRLMQTNMGLAGIGTPCFCANAETDHILLMSHILLTTITADKLLELFSGFADMALGWQQNHFMSPEELENGLGAEKRQAAASKSTLNRFKSQFSKSSASAENKK